MEAAGARGGGGEPGPRGSLCSNAIHPSQPLNGGPVHHLQKPSALALLVAMATPGPDNGLSVSLCPIESAEKASGWDYRRERNVPSPCQPFCLSRPPKQIGE